MIIIIIWEVVINRAFQTMKAVLNAEPVSGARHLKFPFRQKLSTLSRVWRSTGDLRASKRNQSAQELNQRLQALMTAVHMGNSPAYAGYSDPAAAELAMRLGLEDEVEKELISASMDCYPEQYSWIDEQVMSFFEAYPRGLGVEIFGGLSTRFHRVSQQLEWPQFSWHCVDKVDVANAFRSAFPASDNFYLHGANNPMLDWGRVVSSPSASSPNRFFPCTSSLNSTPIIVVNSAAQHVESVANLSHRVFKKDTSLKKFAQQCFSRKHCMKTSYLVFKPSSSKTKECDYEEI